MSSQNAYERPTSPVSALENYLTLWFLLATMVGGGLGYFVTDLSTDTSDAGSRATRMVSELGEASQR